MDACAFDKLFARNVPHIVEAIFLSLDYQSYKNCFEVSSTWNAQLKSQQYHRRAKRKYQDGIYRDERKLWDASNMGKINEVRKLLSTGLLDVNFSSGHRSHKSTSLCEAAAMGQREVVKLLLDSGANPNKTDSLGRTPLNQAIGFRHVIQILVDRGADLEKADKNGCTPLHRAAQYGHFDGVQLLLDLGADINKKDKSGRSVLAWAERTNQKDVIEHLVNRGARTDFIISASTRNKNSNFRSRSPRETKRED